MTDKMAVSAKVVEYQLNNISLLQSMYPLPSELETVPSSIPILNALQADPPKPLPTSAQRVELMHTIRIDGLGNYDLIISLPLTRPRIELNLRQPGWLTRTEWERVRPLDPSPDNEELVVEYLLDAKELIQKRIDALRSEADAADVKPDLSSTTGADKGKGKSCLERVWFWFPSLSSKEKRRDLVNFAEEHLLSGFLLAGKPGLLCVEGCGKEVDRYMSRIKSESWSDIPPHQKKVTERLRRPLEQHQRCFQSMVDITDQISKYGQYNHRGEMSEVKRLMDAWGVGEDFSAVVMNSA